MSVSYKLFNTGFCSSLEKLALRTAPWRYYQFPAMFALIQHSRHGNILFDTGHSARFFQATKFFPMNIYRWLVHVEHETSMNATELLKSIGLTSKDIDYIVISHFHADHIGALCDFPRAKFIYIPQSYQAVANLNQFRALRAGFLADLLPNDFIKRSLPLTQKLLVSLSKDYYPFKQGYALFDDEDILAVELPGHAPGQMGLLLNASNGEKVFLVADACWSSESYKKLIMPHGLSFLIMSGKQDYIKTLTKIHDLHHAQPELKIIPSHCRQLWQTYCS